MEYVGADYINAVVEGEIVSPEEYAEMEEFTALLAEGVAQLPDADGKQDLQRQAEALQQAVTDKAGEPRIGNWPSPFVPPWFQFTASRCRQKPRRIWIVLPRCIKPSAPPAMARKVGRWSRGCGNGAGAHRFYRPGSLQRSLTAGLHTTITAGSAGGRGDTLSDEDRWALAFYVGAKAVSDEMAETGKTAFNRIPGMKTSSLWIRW